MSAADDVFEMQSLCGELADRLAGSRAKGKQRVKAVADAIDGISWNRALEFLSGKARRVDAWEKEHAKRRLEELAERERRKREREHLQWLSAEVDRAGLAGAAVDELQRFLRRPGGEAGAMAVPETAGGHDPAPDYAAFDQSREFEG